MLAVPVAFALAFALLHLRWATFPTAAAAAFRPRKCALSAITSRIGSGIGTAYGSSGTGSSDNHGETTVFKCPRRYPFGGPYSVLGTLRSAASGRAARGARPRFGAGLPAEALAAIAGQLDVWGLVPSPAFRPSDAGVTGRPVCRRAPASHAYLVSAVNRLGGGAASRCRVGEAPRLDSRWPRLALVATCGRSAVDDPDVGIGSIGEAHEEGA